MWLNIQYLFGKIELMCLDKNHFMSIKCRIIFEEHLLNNGEIRNEGKQKRASNKCDRLLKNHNSNGWLIGVEYSNKSSLILKFIFYVCFENIFKLKCFVIFGFSYFQNKLKMPNDCSENDWGAWWSECCQKCKHRVDFGKSPPGKM